MPFATDIMAIPRHSNHTTSPDYRISESVLSRNIAFSIPGYWIVGKRLIDLVLSILVLILASPVLMITAFLIKCSSPGPVFFKQWRYGLHGKPFIIYKLRTMSVCEDGYCITPVKINDHRITQLGQFLRKSSIDEIPQFYNVLKGNMTLVGPRPHAISMANEYIPLIENSINRFCVKPGITGLAQLMGTRGEVQSIELVKKMIFYDLHYIKTWSIWLDFTLMFRTLHSVLFDNANVL